nr:MAG TPA: Cytochrome C' [Caudoviricetes sp.]
MTGIGPVTSALPMRRTTDCATSASCHKAYVE